jgi:hypothetical protein
MIEVMPKETERLYRQNKLKDRLNSVVDRADTLLEDLIAAGRREDEAMQIVTANILAPGEHSHLDDEDGQKARRKQMKPKLRDKITKNILYNL